MTIFRPDKVREFREAAGMTQHDLGVLLGAHPQRIAQIEGGVGVHSRTLCRLCDALGRQPGEFFSGGSAATADVGITPPPPAGFPNLFRLFLRGGKP